MLGSPLAGAAPTGRPGFDGPTPGFSHGADVPSFGIGVAVGRGAPVGGRFGHDAEVPGPGAGIGGWPPFAMGGNPPRVWGLGRMAWVRGATSSNGKPGRSGDGPSAGAPAC